MSTTKRATGPIPAKDGANTQQNAAHTKEPWTAIIDNPLSTLPGHSIKAKDACQAPIAIVHAHKGSAGPAEGISNAERIVACVNALAGIANPAAIPAAIEALRGVIASAYPSEVEHPKMAQAWAAGRQALADLERLP